MDNPRSDSDEDLVARAGRGDPAAVQALVARKLPRILALAARMLGDASEAEDVAQEVFLRVWREAPRWRPGEARFDTWMHRVALNLCHDRLRRRRDIPMAEPPEIADPARSAEQVMESADAAEAVAAALIRLPPRQREAVVLSHYQELGGAEAALVMEVSLDAFESLLARARRSLKEMLAHAREP
ncbi:MAG: RNA polymerase sigma factor [Caulobacteraceae bacterium]